MKSFLDRLGKELLFFDGAMGTMLLNEGLMPGQLPELLNLTSPALISRIHSSYLASGCQILKTNTFGANRFKLRDSGYQPDQVICAAVAAAQKAAADCGKDAYVALDIGPSGKLLKPYGDLDFEDAYEAFAEMVRAGAAAGADLILIETMSDTYEMKAAILAAKENSSLPLVTTFTFDESGKLLTGADIATALLMAEGLGADVLGFNCGLGPRQLKNLLAQAIPWVETPICINPNAGLPVTRNGATVYDLSAAEFADEMEGLIRMGVAIAGGCCGTTPAYLAAMIQKCQGLPVQPVSKTHFTAATSYGKTVLIGDQPILIGERLNPTGKPLLKQALKDNDLEYLYREALLQEEHGAHILDVNVGTPGIDETTMMVNAITGIQGITDLPLQIDTTNGEALKAALRVYNGKPIINSVNGKEESMSEVFPLAKKYGALVVALTLDESGIPDDARGRIAIAEKIIKRAEEYGIQKKNLLIDTLAMTISTGKEQANVTLETLDYIRNTLKVNTVLGVSNISFGLPMRDYISSTFFTLALSRGLSAGIVNPVSFEMMKAYDTFLALKGLDDQCAHYIECYSAMKPAPAALYVQNQSHMLPAHNTTVDAGTTPGANNSATTDAGNDKSPQSELMQAIIKGLKQQAYDLAKIAIINDEPLNVINEQMIPALDYVGKGFEQKTVFLPQLLMSAEAAKRAFSAIKEQMARSGKKQEKKGRIVLATVKGDIHDIGKNIVKVLLENYGYDVIDLGKDVPPETVVKEVLEKQVPLVGLSALMTTTVINMEETICMLKEQAPDCKIMVGGAVLTADYAAKIGADFYGKDAMASVRYAGEVL